MCRFYELFFEYILAHFDLYSVNFFILLEIRIGCAAQIDIFPVECYAFQNVYFKVSLAIFKLLTVFFFTNHIFDS